jgi:hypothetical protein
MNSGATSATIPVCMARAGRDDTRGGAGRSEPTPGHTRSTVFTHRCRASRGGCSCGASENRDPLSSVPRKTCRIRAETGYYDEQGAFHALRPATRARSTGNAAVDTGLSYRASNELFQRFPENAAERGETGRPAHRNTAAAGGVHCGERGEFGARYPHAKSVSSLRYWT